MVITPNDKWDVATETALQTYWDQPNASSVFINEPPQPGGVAKQSSPVGAGSDGNPPGVPNISPMDKARQATNTTAPPSNELDWRTMYLDSFQNTKEKHESEQKRLKQAAAFSSVGNLIKNIVDFAGAKYPKVFPTPVPASARMT